MKCTLYGRFGFYFNRNKINSYYIRQRCLDEERAKFDSLTATIKLSKERQTKPTYVDTKATKTTKANQIMSSGCGTFSHAGVNRSSVGESGSQNATKSTDSNQMRKYETFFEQNIPKNTSCTTANRFCVEIIKFLLFTDTQENDPENPTMIPIGHPPLGIKLCTKKYVNRNRRSHQLRRPSICCVMIVLERSKKGKRNGNRTPR